ncbi:MAG: group 1 truncated hemoglobin [Rhodospirillaceae bacterium]|nr:group 1 truncated hemoglobin [Rhodospirillaceae bacterium]
MPNLLDRLGGESAVNAVVDKFYDKVFSDQTLAPFFANTDFAKQRVRQKRFLIQLMSGQSKDPATYMRNAHRKYVDEMGLNDSHFDIVAGHLVTTLREFKVSDTLIAEVGSALESLRGAVLNRVSENAA